MFLGLELGHVLRLGTRCFNMTLELGSNWIASQGQDLGAGWVQDMLLIVYPTSCT